MKNREFWITDNSKNHPPQARYLCSSCAPRPVSFAIHVREVSPEYDALVEEMIEACKYYAIYDGNTHAIDVLAKLEAFKGKK